MLKFYSKLLPELNGLAANGAILDTESITLRLFQKYFQPKLCPGQQKDQDKAELSRLLDIRTNQSEEIPVATDDLWIFGYGSLVWKADFPYIDRRRGFIKGFTRRFYQHSIDHRGTEKKPGRVVTLIPTEDESDRVYGMAYRISCRHKTDVLKHLDHREKNGYERCELSFYEYPEAAGCSFNIIMYIATQENESWAGDIWQVERIAEQIFTSAGPSGPNRDYLFNLANAMRILYPGEKDEHLFELEKAVLQKITSDEPILLKKAILNEIACILRNAELNICKTEKGDDELISELLQQFETLKANCDKPGWKESILTKELALN